MKYNFDRQWNRLDTQASKWGKTQELFGRQDVLPMWVADMDFECPQPVVEAIKERLEHPIFGYTYAHDSFYDTVVKKVRDDYGWEIKREWIVLSPGVISSLYTSLKLLTSPGDEVLLQPPVYYPFFSTIRNSGCQTVQNQLRFDGQHYTMDLEDLANKFENSSLFPTKSHRIKAMLLCSPHNPVGRVWKASELEMLGELCLEHKVPIISDEIHCDLLRPGLKHVATASISPELEQNTITLMAPSKTFNLAGLKASIAIIPNDAWRTRFETMSAGQGGVNIFGLVAMEAAFKEGGDYIRQVCEYIFGNVTYFSDYIKENIPQLKVIETEGTYLVWVDARGLAMNDQQLQRFFVEKAGIALDYGYAFGPGGSGFQRFNLACPRSIVEEAVKRIHVALNTLS